MIGSGHGWVRPLPSGITAKCGGPDICSLCNEELTRLTEAVKHLYNWQMYPGDNFHNVLYYLIGKSDVQNRSRFAMGFPWESEAFRQWEAASDQWDFFAQFGFDRQTSRSTPSPEERKENEKKE